MDQKMEARLQRLLDKEEIHDSPRTTEPGYNSLHFSPQASTHFWAWWRLFDGSMSLPIRQGKLFPSAQPPSRSRSIAAQP